MSQTITFQSAINLSANDAVYWALWPQKDDVPTAAAGPTGYLVPPGEMVVMQVQRERGALWMQSSRAYPGDSFRLMYTSDNGNRTEDDIGLRPVEKETEQIPVFLLLLCAMLLGMFIGAIGMKVSYR